VVRDERRGPRPAVAWDALPEGCARSATGRAAILVVSLVAVWLGVPLAHSGIG
jgi:hypothetical protein